MRSPSASPPPARTTSSAGTATRAWLALAAVAAGALAWVPRTVTNLTVPYDPETPREWFSADPDGLYHARRLERLLREGAPVAERDPYLAYPDGAPIPWPPYYTYVLAALVGPGLPRAEDVSSRARLERAVASAPRALAAATAAVLALTAGVLGARTHGTATGAPARARAAAVAGAVVAGGSFALMRASIWTSALGMGDHHAWISLLFAALLGLFASGLDTPLDRPLDTPARRRARGAVPGALAGVVAGLALGSWVASLVLVLLLQVALGWRILVHARRPRPGLVPFGLAFHLAAAATLAPAVLSSPWKAEFPWMVVNLSWFHLAHLLLGAAVFAPLLRLRAGARAFRAYPWLVGAALAALGLVVAAVDAGPGRGIREGFAWAGRTNAFMGFVAESQPMWGGAWGGLEVPVSYLGLAAPLLVPAWAWAAWRAARGGETALTAAVVCAPVLLAQALVQKRFSDNLAVAGCLLLGWAAARLVGSPRAPALLRRAPVAAAAALALVLAANASVVRDTWPALGEPRSFQTVPSVAAEHRVRRRAVEWLGRAAPRPADYSVLAPWSHGHAIEWVADLPTVATNFGLYVGEDAYRDPYRFLLEADPVAAEALLARRRARYVLVTGALPATLPVALDVALPGGRERFLAGPWDDVAVARPAWYRTMGARLLQDGVALDPAAPDAATSESLAFLRLVHVPAGRAAAIRLYPFHAAPRPFAWVWERVAGARLVAQGAAPGETLSLALDVEYPGHALRWTGAAAAGDDGRVELRVPYATDDPNGDGRVVGRPVWELGERRGRARISAADVLAGRRIELGGR